MEGPNLFVVCKNCQEEVSPYITECPYCGHRLRKRAPKLEKGMAPSPRPRRGPAIPARSSGTTRIKRPAKSRRERAERPSWAGTGRPYASLFIVVASVVITLAGRAGLDESDYVLGFGDEPWRAVPSLFVYFGTGYELIALAVAFLFAWLLERRHGWWAPLAVFLIGGGAGMLLVVGVDEGSLAVGGNGAALALLAAWAMRDVLGRRQGREDDSDLLGVLVIAALLVLLPVASQEAHAMAGLGGGVAGILMGLGLARLRA